MKKKFFNSSLWFAILLTPIFVFLYETKKMTGIKDLFDIEDDNEL